MCSPMSASGYLLCWKKKKRRKREMVLHIDNMYVATCNPFLFRTPGLQCRIVSLLVSIECADTAPGSGGTSEAYHPVNVKPE